MQNDYLSCVTKEKPGPQVAKQLAGIYLYLIKKVPEIKNGAGITLLAKRSEYMGSRG